MTSTQYRAFIITMMLMVSSFLITNPTVAASGPGMSSPFLEGVSLGNTSDVQVPLKVSYAKNLGLTLDDVDMGLVIGSTFAHQEMYLTADKMANVDDSTNYCLNTSYQLISHTDIGFEMALPKEGNYSVNDDIVNSPRETRHVIGQIELRLAIRSEGVLTLRNADGYVTAYTGHLDLRCEMIVKGSNLPVAVYHGDYTNLTYQDVNGSMRSSANLNHSFVLNPIPTIQASESALNLTTNASLSMNLTGFIDAQGIPQNIEDELFGKTLASYGIFTLPVRFENIGYLVQAINRHSLGNQTIPITMMMSFSDPTGDGLNKTALTFGGANSTATIYTKNDRLEGMELQNPWQAATNALGLSLGSWDMWECGHDQSENGMDLTRGLMASLPSTLFSNDTPPLSVTEDTATEGSTGSDLWMVACIVILVALPAVAAIAYKRKR